MLLPVCVAVHAIPCFAGKQWLVFQALTGLENKEVPGDMRFPETRMPGHREMPPASQTRSSNGPFLPLRLHTAGRASAKGTRPRSDISAFGSKRPKKKPQPSENPGGSKRGTGRMWRVQSGGCQGEQTPPQTFCPPNNSPAPAEPQQIRKHKRDFIFPLSPKLGLLCTSQQPSRSWDWGMIKLAP